MTAVALSISAIVFDCREPTSLAVFWAKALGYATNIEDPEHAWAYHPSRVRPYLLFNRVLEPKTAKNRVHLDLETDDVESEVRRLESLGARRIRLVVEGPRPWWVMADPEGNEFCVFSA